MSQRPRTGRQASALVTVREIQEKRGGLTKEALQNLSPYRYSSVDKSYLSQYVLKYYWNWCAEFLPLWLAPNMVTLLGFFCILFNIGLLVVMVPDMVGPAPGWVYVSFGLGTWVYSTMDNIDGKQARKTGTSSALGELFDHGIDSLNCTLASLLQATCLGLGTSRTGVFTALLPTLPMFLSTWETFHTHTLYLGYMNGPTEGLLIASAMMVATGIYGPGMWAAPVANISPSIAFYIGAETSIRDLWVPLLGLFLVAHLPGCVMHVARARRDEGKPFLPVLKEWTQMIVFALGCLTWLGSPHSTVRSHNHVVLFCVTMSCVFGRMTTKIILAHLTRQPYPHWTYQLLPLVCGSLLVNLYPLLRPFVALSVDTQKIELGYLWFYFAYATIVYLHWAFVVCNAICEHLGINCLTIKPSTLEELKKKAK